MSAMTKPMMRLQDEQHELQLAIGRISLGRNGKIVSRTASGKNDTPNSVSSNAPRPPAAKGAFFLAVLHLLGFFAAPAALGASAPGFGFPLYAGMSGTLKSCLGTLMLGILAALASGGMGLSDTTVTHF